MTRCRISHHAKLEAEIERLRAALVTVQEWYSGNTVRSNKALRPMVEIVDAALSRPRKEPWDDARDGIF